MDSYRLYEVNEYIKRVIALNFEEAVWIECEINQINEKRGNYYLELIEKSEETEEIIAKSRASMWYKNAMFIKKKLGKLFESILVAGVQVKVKCNVSFSERYGFNFLIEDIDVNYTVGQMEIQRQKVIARLKEENLLDLNLQKVMPTVMQRIAIVSSETAAGYADFLRQLQTNEYGYDFELSLYDVAVQGGNMESEITAAIREINKLKDEYDCVVVIRGGGSKLDLSGFDNYNIAAHIARCEIPVITGIGHEIDQTVSDLTSNLSLKTPTAVAGYLIDRLLHFESQIIEMTGQINHHIESILSHHSAELALTHDRIAYGIKDRFSSERIGLDSLQSLIRNHSFQMLKMQKQRLESAEGLIKAIHPDNILKRGFVYITDKDGKHLTRKSAAEKKAEMDLHFFDGKLNVKK